MEIKWLLVSQNPNLDNQGIDTFVNGARSGGNRGKTHD